VLAYSLKRLLAGLVTVFFIATATFVAMHAVPGDPLTGGKARSAEIRANLQARYGLDKPVLVQYGVFLRNMAKGDFGISFTQQNRSVNDIIREHFPISATLGVLALLFSVAGGILFGSITARARGRLSDNSVMFLVILGISVPSFVFAAVGQYVAVELNHAAGRTLLPVAGWGTFRHMLLPALVDGLGTMAFLTRLMRSSLLEIVNQDYIRTAKAKGLGQRSILFLHALKNAAVPIVTVIGIGVALLIGGAVVTESVFAIPGLGRLTVDAILRRDYPVIQGVVLLFSFVYVLVNLAVDLVYTLFDPRIRY
jgi:ABC-type dipeptide/oligopeptide/nickel transport system permease component